MPAQNTSVPVVIPEVGEEKRTRVAYVWLSSVKKIVAFVERIRKVKETLPRCLKGSSCLKSGFVLYLQQRCGEKQAFVLAAS